MFHEQELRLNDVLHDIADEHAGCIDSRWAPDNLGTLGVALRQAEAMTERLRRAKLGRPPAEADVEGYAQDHQFDPYVLGALSRSYLQQRRYEKLRRLLFENLDLVFTLRTLGPTEFDEALDRYGQ
jgi:hypothetical protein